MDSSFLSIVVFVCITIFYFWVGKPAIKTDSLSDLSLYTKSSMMSLGMYWLATVISQSFINMGYLMSTCGGSLSSNIGAAFLYTFVPWSLIFAPLMACVLMFPNMKNAFSDVVGYFVVSSKASDVISNILSSTDSSKTKEATDAIMKIYGNKSILINQFKIHNFNEMWDKLQPLMSPNANEFKQTLLDLVVLKDNVGEGLWYIYTAILVSSIVYYNLSTRGCVKSASQIKQDRDAYLKEKENIQTQQQLASSTLYTSS